MNKATGVVEILKTEYGIESLAQLQDAISKLGLIDLSPFCADIPKEKEKTS